MLIKGIKDECLGDFKEIGMLVVFPNCNWKCDKECGRPICQNSSLAAEPLIEVPRQSIISRYIASPISRALICGGLEPFDSFSDLYDLLIDFRKETSDPIVIYTGYTEAECDKMIGMKQIRDLGNIYIKYGRFVPDMPSRQDELLGIQLASDNQYARYYK